MKYWKNWRGKERKERVEKIVESKYNEWYKKVMTEEVPAYLRGKRNKKKERNMIARFRCGNEMRGSQH